jgi:hypothetical protein
MRKLTALFALVLSLTVVSVGVASGAVKGTSRPYKDKGSAVIDAATFSIAGTRNATHLGNSTWATSNVAIDLSNLGNNIVGVTYDDTITAANGDTLTTKAVATIDISALGVSPLPFAAVETITGGTGRFVGASGSFKVTGLVDLFAVPAPTLTFTSTGTISY